MLFYALDDDLELADLANRPLQKMNEDEEGNDKTTQIEHIKDYKMMIKSEK